MLTKALATLPVCHVSHWHDVAVTWIENIHVEVLSQQTFQHVCNKLFAHNIFSCTLWHLLKEKPCFVYACMWVCIYCSLFVSDHTDSQHPLQTHEKAIFCSENTFWQLLHRQVWTLKWLWMTKQLVSMCTPPLAVAARRVTLFGLCTELIFFKDANPSACTFLMHAGASTDIKSAMWV